MPGHFDRQGDHVVAAKLNPVIEQMKLSRFSGGNMVETILSPLTRL